MLKVDAVIATYNRADCITDAVDSLLKNRDEIGNIYVVVNGSKDNSLEKLSTYSNDPKVVVISLEDNLGAPGGKNVGMRQSDAEILVIIDDDAEFYSDEPIKKIKEIFSSDPTLGIIQFKVVNYQLKRILHYEFPGNDPDTQGDTIFLIGSFTGAGHAIRKCMLDVVGYYPDSFFYAHEELDLSFRAVQGGWKIQYNPLIGVYHKKNPKGRLPDRDLIKKMLLNRMIISRKYLPLIYRSVSAVLWCIKTAIWSRSISVPMGAIREYFQIRPKIKRQPLDSKAMFYFRQNYGRLWC